MDDGSGHPNFAATQRNEQSLFLGLLCREVRQNIYKFATCVDKPIKPQQAAPNSNKFVWGDHTIVESYPRRKLKSTEPQLVAVSLARTCRAIYAEVQAYAAFYQFNSFEFCNADDLHAFLAALTPLRRNALRRITIVSQLGWTMSHCPIWNFEQLPRERFRRRDHPGELNDAVLSLLSTYSHSAKTKTR
ncbi:hypothetical protein F5Y04DRAFT_230939 [Hypomontagnella monticulosa]|nr:hypothetical protein F5Y04DRAFT_230939 [Hypomontagnella monticulosa]